MKTKFLLLCGLLAVAVSDAQAAQLGTGINYQGRLTDGGSPANGTHSFKMDQPVSPTRAGER